MTTCSPPLPLTTREEPVNKRDVDPSTNEVRKVLLAALRARKARRRLKDIPRPLL